jgi:hypothetical protein
LLRIVSWFRAHDPEVFARLFGEKHKIRNEAELREYWLSKSGKEGAKSYEAEGMVDVDEEKEEGLEPKRTASAKDGVGLSGIPASSSSQAAEAAEEVVLAEEEEEEEAPAAENAEVPSLESTKTTVNYPCASHTVMVAAAVAVAAPIQDVVSMSPPSRRDGLFLPNHTDASTASSSSPSPPVLLQTLATSESFAMEDEAGVGSTVNDKGSADVLPPAETEPLSFAAAAIVAPAEKEEGTGSVDLSRDLIISTLTDKLLGFSLLSSSSVVEDDEEMLPAAPSTTAKDPAGEQLTDEGDTEPPFTGTLPVSLISVNANEVVVPGTDGGSAGPTPPASFEPSRVDLSPKHLSIMSFLDLELGKFHRKVAPSFAAC